MFKNSSDMGQDKKEIPRNSNVSDTNRSNSASLTPGENQTSSASQRSSSNNAFAGKSQELQ